MEPIHTSLEYIRDLAKYQHERPYQVFVNDEQLKKYVPDDPKLNTVELEAKATDIYDLRSLEDVRLENYGFQTSPCEFTPFSLASATTSGIALYQTETEELLSKLLGAEKVISYDCRMRQSGHSAQPGSQTNINDPLFIDVPVRGAHNHTYESAPLLIKKVCEETNNTRYLDGRYRLRIINTWRPLIEKLEVAPLAVCNYRTLAIDDLIATDRIYVSIKSQVYFLRHNKTQRWYWFSHQTPNELLLMLMYDTKPCAEHANFCPHVSFDNPKAEKNAGPRESIETRNIVITLASENDG